MSFRSVYREHHAFVWQSLRCLGVVDSVLDDAVQDVFVVVHRRLGEFEGRASVRTWIFGIARRIALRYRSRARRRTFELPDLRGETDVEAAVERALALETLRAFIDRLDDDRVQVFMLAEFGQLRGREIAETLGVNINTVYARLRSARAELDRLAKRLRAREAATLVATCRRTRPPTASRRRTWSALTLQLGLGKAAAAPVAAAPLKFLAAGAVLGMIIGATTLGALTPDAANTAAPSRAAPTASTPASTGANPEPAAPATTTPPQTGNERAPADPSPKAGAPSTVPNAAPTPAAPSKPEPAPAREAPRLRPKRAAALPALDSARGRDQLTEEVAHVMRIRAAVELGQRARARTEIALYRRTYRRGGLRPEVDVLAAELRCTAKHEREPETIVEQFARKHPGRWLVDRLRRVCGVGSRPETHRM